MGADALTAHERAAIVAAHGDSAASGVPPIPEPVFRGAFVTKFDASGAPVGAHVSLPCRWTAYDEHIITTNGLALETTRYEHDEVVEILRAYEATGQHGLFWWWEPSVQARMPRAPPIRRAQKNLSTTAPLARATLAATGPAFMPPWPPSSTRPRDRPPACLASLPTRTRTSSSLPRSPSLPSTALQPLTLHPLTFSPLLVPIVMPFERVRSGGERGGFPRRPALQQQELRREAAIGERPLWWQLDGAVHGDGRHGEREGGPMRLPGGGAVQGVCLQPAHVLTGGVRSTARPHHHTRRPACVLGCDGRRCERGGRQGARGSVRMGHQE